MIPHPKRVINEKFIDDSFETIGPIASLLLRENLSDLNYTKGKAVEDSNFAGRIKKLAAGTLDMGVLNYLLSPVRFIETNGRYFEVSDQINEQLLNTDIGRQAPANYFRPPFPSIYMYLTNPVSALKVVNERRGAVSELEGVYIAEITPENLSDIDALKKYGGDTSATHRVYELTFIGQPLGHPLSCDMMYTRLTIPADWEEKPLEEVIDKGFSTSTKAGLNELSDEGYQELKNLVTHIAKIFLYIASEDSVMEYIDALNELQERIKRVKSAKQGKLEKRLSRTYNFIRIGGHNVEPGARPAPQSQTNKKATHWRRGHFRNQAFGEGRTKHKLIYIKPALIGSLGQAENKTYRVK